MNSNHPYRHYVIRLTAVYSIIALLWIMVSTPLLEQFFHHPILVTVCRIMFYALSAGVVFSMLLYQQKLLLYSREDYNHLFSTLREPVFMHRDGVILDANEYALKLLGATEKHQLIGRSILDFIRPEYVILARERISVLHRGQSTPPSDQEWFTLSGDTRYVQVVGVNTIFRGKPVIQCIVHDMTERRLAEELIARSDKLSMVGQLAAGVAHEIRNPLTSLKGFVQLIDQGATDNLSYYCQVMSDEVERIELIVNEFLVLSKSPTLQMKLNDMTRLVQETLALLTPEAHLRNIEIRTELTSDIPLVLCDRNRVKQVLVNLFKNAIESVPSQGHVSVRVGSDSPNDITISVKDNGIGIPQEQIDRLGEPFFTTKTTGTGLGLMISYKIIHAHGGQLEFQSVVNEGTEAVVRLPVSAPDGTAQEILQHLI